MLSENALTPEQNEAIDFIYQRDRSILVAPTGEGKTVICLTAIAALVANAPKFQVLIACPPKVIPVYRKEALKWDHLAKLRIVEMHGDALIRQQQLEDSDEANILVVSLNSLEWALQPEFLKVQGVVIDELSKAAGKMTAALRHRAWEKRIWWRVGMTATPVSQDFQKLFNMTRVIAGARIFGNNADAYRNTYFYPDYNGHTWTLRDGADKQILDKVAQLVHLIANQKADKLPPLTERVVRFDMPKDTRAAYDAMAADMVLDLRADKTDDANIGDVLEAGNQAVKSGKMRQLASGFIYDKTDMRRFDYARQAAFLQELDTSADPVLVFYEFEEQKAEIRWCGDNIAFSREEFDPKEHKALAVQVKSLSHGVDGLQHVFHRVIFYQPMWSRDAQQQARDRVWRQGQRHPVDAATLVCDATLDDVVIDRVAGRGKWMELFQAHLLARRAVRADRPAAGIVDTITPQC